MKAINHKGLIIPKQDFILPELRESYSINPWPQIFRRNEKEFLRILNSSSLLGLDYEFDGNKITQIGIANLKECSSLFYEPRYGSLIHEKMSRGVRFVGHSIVGAEKKVMEENGIKTSLDWWEDSMITHYMTHAHLTKAPGMKEENEEAGSLGFMGLGTVAALKTNLPVYKNCRGASCEGPCPLHDPLGYNALDAWVSLRGFEHDMKLFEEYGVPLKLYREWLELAEYCQQMEDQGVYGDREKISYHEGEIQKKKASFFIDNKPFNPASPSQALNYFKGFGITLPTADKEELRDKILAKASLSGVSMEDFIEKATGVEKALCDLFLWKDTGKGLMPWFDDKYWGKDSLLHPRWVYVGSSFGRLSCVRPNLMNVATRGWGTVVRQVIGPQDKSQDWTKADCKQLELRQVLYQSGVDPSIIGEDAFTWLVNQDPAPFMAAAKLVNPKEYSDDPKKAARNVAKITSHLSDYLGGIQLLSITDLEKRNVKEDIESGALRPYLTKYKSDLKKDWLFRGKIVAFNGVRLAQELFHGASKEQRADALRIQEDIFFAKFPMIREWQQRALEDAQDKGYIKSSVGSFCRLYGDDEDVVKLIPAFYGQGVSALHMHALMLKFKRGCFIPRMQVHDELDFTLPGCYSDKDVLSFYKDVMEQETDRLPGFISPISVYRGKCWREAKKGSTNKEELKEIF